MYKKKEVSEELEKNEFHEQLIYAKVELIVDLFIDSSKLTKNEFLKKVFDSAFELMLYFMVYCAENLVFTQGCNPM